MPNHENYDAYVRRARLRHGDKFDDSQLVAKFRPFLHSGQRIRVQDGDYVRTGTVGITTGWRPAFLLMHRSSDHGSGDLLSDKSVITHVQHGRTYVPVANLYRDPNKPPVRVCYDPLDGDQLGNVITVDGGDPIEYDVTRAHFLENYPDGMYTPA